MFNRIRKIFKDKSFPEITITAIRLFLYKAFAIRMVGNVSFASAKPEKKVFAECRIKDSIEGFYFLDPMPSADSLSEYYRSFYWDETKKAKKNYGANTRDFLHYHLLREYIPEEIKGQKTFLNFGAGHGGISHLLWLNGMNIINIEPSGLPAYYSCRWQTFPELENVQSNSVDIIYGSHSLEHVLDIKQSKSEFQRVLKPGGFMFWEVPNAENAVVGGKSGRIDIPHTYYFRRAFFENWFRETLLCDGFDQVSWKETDIIERWEDYRDSSGLVIRALGRF